MGTKGRSVPSIIKALTLNGGAWRPSTILGILRNSFHSGRVELDGELIRIAHDAIVAEETSNVCKRSA